MSLVKNITTEPITIYLIDGVVSLQPDDVIDISGLRLKLASLRELVVDCKIKVYHNIERSRAVAPQNNN